MTNKEIKFRAWHPDLKYMIYFDGLNMSWDQQMGGYRLISNANEVVVFHCFQDQPQIMQSTGVRDGKRREIYEGDQIHYQGRLGVVEFFAGMFVVSWHDQTDTELAYMQINDMEVVGNIFENPELLV